MPDDFMARIAAAEKAAEARGVKMSNPDAIRNAPRGPKFMEEMDRARYGPSSGGSWQDVIDAVMETPGDIASWTAAVVAATKGAMDTSEARLRVADAVFWYRRRKRLVVVDGKERLVAV